MISRRDFLHTSLAIGCTGLGCVALSGCSTLSASIQTGQEKDNTAMSAGRFGLVVDVEKYKKSASFSLIASVCHKAHNIPRIPDDKQAIQWIREADYKACFSEAERQHVGIPSLDVKLPVMCNHCETPACVTVCPTQATFKRPDGIVEMDYHRCIGCRFCMAACPYDARSFNFVDPKPYIDQVTPNYPTRTDGVVEKCNFCVERLTQGLEPLCVEASGGSILFGDLDDPTSEVSQAIVSGTVLTRSEELGVEPGVKYLFREGHNND